MDPSIGRVAFNIAILLIVMALIPLPFLDRDSAEFVVDVVALLISTTFLTIVTWDVRRQVRMVKLNTEKDEQVQGSG